MKVTKEVGVVVMPETYIRRCLVMSVGQIIICTIWGFFFNDFVQSVKVYAMLVPW